MEGHVRVTYRIENLPGAFLAVTLAVCVGWSTGVAAEDEASLNKTQKAIYETLAISDKIKEQSPFKDEATFSLPTFESVEAKAVHYKLSDSLWKLSEDYSVKESERFMAETTGSFDKDKVNQEFKDSFREYLKKNDLVRGESRDDFEKAKSDFVREDEMADFKDHMKAMDEDKFFKESQKGYKEFLTLEAKAEKDVRELEKQQENADKRVAKSEEKAVTKAEDKKDTAVAQDNKKDDTKDDDTGKDEDKDGDKHAKKK